MKTIKYRRFSLEDWQRMFEMEALGKGIQEIAGSLRRDRKAVREALKRYPMPWHIRYPTPLDRARYAWEQSERIRHQSRRRVRLKNSFIRKYVEERLRDGWSPEIIAGRLSVEHPEQSISYEAIYDWIYTERPDLKKYLLRAGKSRRGKPGARGRSRRKPAAPKTSIEQRPEIVNRRERLGDHESDLIVSSKNDACLLVLVERRSRRVRLKRIPNRKAETVKAALVSLMVHIPPVERLTLTQDNGSEHALHAELEATLDIEVFFSHPYRACERGTVENRNGWIRRFYPKGTDFNALTDTQIAQMEEKINSYPMAVLGFLTPDEFYQRESMKLAA